MPRHQADFRLDRNAGLPLGVQLAAKLRALIASEHLAPGDQLPSLRDLAATAEVNVNTVRSVYLRLENEGLVQTEHGRGTFVAQAGTEAATRRELRGQIAQLEAALVRLPPLATEAVGLSAPPSMGAGLLSAAQLEVVRDRLEQRLLDLDHQRAEISRRLEDFEVAQPAEREKGRSARRSTPSIAGARIRWVGA